MELSEKLQVVNGNESPCPHCNGAKRVFLPDGTSRVCRCRLKEKLIEYVGFLHKHTMLKDTKLLPFLKTKKSIVIETESANVLYSNLKTCLLLNKSINLSWRVVTPDELITMSFTSEDSKLLYGPTGVDLLIIFAPVFPHYEAASKRHEYVISTRQAMNKATWFVTKNFGKLLEGRGLALTEGFRNVLTGLPQVRLTSAEARMLIQRKAEKTVLNVVRGLGLSGVDPSLMEINVELDARVLRLKEHIYGENVSSVNDGQLDR